MSEYTQTLSGQAQWAARNLIFNLDFIPEDKLSWKPAPDANSALEVVDHILGAYAGLSGIIKDPTTPPSFGGGDESKVASKEEASEKLLAAVDSYCALIGGLSEEDLKKPVQMPFGTFPLSFIVSMAPLDTVHHHGQIAYIQTLLGDTESHFDFSLLPQA